MSTIFDYDSLGTILFGKSRRLILALLYGHTDEEFYLRQIIRIIGMGPGPVQRELKQLVGSGIITSRKRGNQLYFQANPENPIYEELKSIVRKTFGVAEVIRQALSPGADTIRVAFIFGSVARSTDDRRSDIDVLVVGDITFAEVVSLVHPAEEKIGREINPVVYATSEYRTKKKEDNHFIRRILDEEKIFVIGDADELGKLAE